MYGTSVFKTTKTDLKIAIEMANLLNRIGMEKLYPTISFEQHPDYLFKVHYTVKVEGGKEWTGLSCREANFIVNAIVEGRKHTDTKVKELEKYIKDQKKEIKKEIKKVLKKLN